MIVYIAGPLTASNPKDMEANVRTAAHWAGNLIYDGHTPICPHLFTSVEREWLNIGGEEFTYERWMQICFDLLDRADALLYLGSSPGADRELQRAIDRRILVYTPDDPPLRDSNVCGAQKLLIRETLCSCENDKKF